MNPLTASATSITSAHHHSDVAAATRPRTSRGTISLHPACGLPRCSATMKFRPIQPMITTRAPDVIAQTMTHTCRTSSWP